MNEGEDFRPIFCFDQSDTLDMYALFPGKMIYVALYHPLKALEPKKIAGRAFYKINFKAKVSQKLSSTTCQNIGLDINEVIEAHKDQEQWFVNLISIL